MDVFRAGMNLHACQVAGAQVAAIHPEFTVNFSSFHFGTRGAEAYALADACQPGLAKEIAGQAHRAADVSNDCVVGPTFDREVTRKVLNPQVAVAQVYPGIAFDVAQRHRTVGRTYLDLAFSAVDRDLAMPSLEL